MPRGYTANGVPVSVHRAIARGYFRIVPKSKPKRESRVYNLYRCMNGRCFNPNHPNFRWYGDKGITVCHEWKEDFEVFRKWCIDRLKVYPGNKWDASLDREDEKGDYSPENCRLLPILENRLRGLHGDRDSE